MEQEKRPPVRKSPRVAGVAPLEADPGLGRKRRAAGCSGAAARGGQASTQAQPGRGGERKSARVAAAEEERQQVRVTAPQAGKKRRQCESDASRAERVVRSSLRLAVVSSDAPV